MSTVQLFTGDSLGSLRMLPSGRVQCVVTSPPYWGLRDYGVSGQIGLEKSLEEYVARMVEVFSEVHRVLRDDGTLWLNLGDSYANARPGNGGKCQLKGAGRAMTEARYTGIVRDVSSLKPKDLIGIPWRVAFALQADGWYLRSDIIWSKPNPMPESVRDRPTKAHEYVFLLTKSSRYYYDAEAVKEPAAQPIGTARLTGQHKRGALQNLASSTLGTNTGASSRNLRSVWHISPQPFKGAHFAVMPQKLVETCIKASSKQGDMILDPFSGSGTTALVAARLGRSAIGLELNPVYNDMARDRLLKAGCLPEGVMMFDASSMGTG